MNEIGAKASFAYTTILLGSGFPDASVNRPAPPKTRFEYTLLWLSTMTNGYPVVETMELNPFEPIKFTPVASVDK
jgi:hypothetical protein